MLTTRRPYTTVSCIEGRRHAGGELGRNWAGTERAARSPAVPQTRFRWNGLDLRFDCNIATISGGLGKGREFGIEAQVCKLSDETLGPHVLRAAIEMVDTEILELHAVLEHAVDGGEQ